MHPHVNIGIAIDLEDRGLIIPGLLNCESKSLADIARGSRDLVERAKADKLRADEYTSTTFTVSNLGMFDVDSFIAIIYPPNSAVLALGRVKDRAIVQGRPGDGGQDDGRHPLNRPPGRGRRGRCALPGGGQAPPGAPRPAAGVGESSSFLRRNSSPQSAHPELVEGGSCSKILQREEGASYPRPVAQRVRTGHSEQRGSRFTHTRLPRRTSSAWYSLNSATSAGRRSMK